MQLNALPHLIGLCCELAAKDIQDRLGLIDTTDKIPVAGDFEPNAPGTAADLKHGATGPGRNAFPELDIFVAAGMKQIVIFGRGGPIFANKHASIFPSDRLGGQAKPRRHMATKRFTEKAIRKANATPAEGSDKDEFEDKVNTDAGLLKTDFYDKQIEVKVKIEKDEVTEKYAKDYADIQHKAQKDMHKEHREVIRPSQPDQPLASRVAALEKTVAQLHHFISAKLRPDLSKGALKREPDTASGPAKKGSS
jgi:hypothetical protein